MATKRKTSKDRLTRDLAEATGTSRRTAAAFVDALYSMAAREAERAGKVNTPEIGTAAKREKKEVAWHRVGRKAANSSKPRPKREIKSSPVRGRFSQSEIRAAVEAVVRRHGSD